MPLRSHLLIVILACLTILPRDTVAGQAEDTFDSLYGGEVSRVVATPDKRDDFVLAARLLEAAKAAKTQRALRGIMCEKAYELGLAHPHGWRTAVEAMELLVRTLPQKAVQCREKLVVVRQRQYSASRGADRIQTGELLIDDLLAVAKAREKANRGSDALTLCEQATVVARTIRSLRKKRIENVVERIRLRRRIAARIDMFKRRLENNKWDSEARNELIRLYVIDSDNPAEAEKYLTLDSDEQFRRFVPLAAKGLRATEKADCLAIGDWYRSLSRQASRPAKPRLLVRAGAYYKRFLKQHIRRDLQRTKATLSLQEIAEELEKLRRTETAGDVKGKPGLRVAYYAMKQPHRLSDFSRHKPFDTRTARHVNHRIGGRRNDRQFPAVPPGAALGAVLTGYIRITVDGEYTFYVASDGSSALHIGGTTVVNNDGSHKLREKSGRIKLNAGSYPLRVEYLSAGGTGRLFVSYKGSGISKRLIPSAVLFHVSADGR